jgi:membrane protease subunit (stomatin/prohibitin family)
MEDPILFEFVTPRIFGEFSLVVVDPVRFVIGYHGQAAGPAVGRDPNTGRFASVSDANDQILAWIKGLFFMSVKTVIAQTCAQQQKSLLNLGGMSSELAARITQSAPNLEEIGIKILQIGNFNINFSPEEAKLLREANQKRGEARRGVAVAQDAARAKQFELDQRFQQDARYVQQLAGNFQNYAAGQAMMGAGEGMSKGGGNSNVAALGAQAAIGVGMAQMMHPAQHQQAPQFVPTHMQQPAQPAAAPPQAAAPSIEARLEKLADLKGKGLITEEEFQARRAKILEEI